jgi:hypothetical protein
MPIIEDWQEDGAEFQLVGRLTQDEIRDCVFNYSSDPRADTARYKIVDMRQTDNVDMSLDELGTLGAFEYGHTLSTPNVRMAFVTADDRFDPSIEAFTRLTREGTWEVRIFRDPDEAVAWAKGGAGVSRATGRP